MKGEVKVNLCNTINESELSICSPILFGWTNFFWNAFTVEGTEFAHYCVWAVSQKLLHPPYIEFISSVASSNKCSGFNFMSLFNFLSKQNCLEYDFQIKI